MLVGYGLRNKSRQSVRTQQSSLTKQIAFVDVVPASSSKRHSVAAAATSHHTSQMSEAETLLNSARQIDEVEQSYEEIFNL